MDSLYLYLLLTMWISPLHCERTEQSPISVLSCEAHSGAHQSYDNQGAEVAELHVGFKEKVYLFFFFTIALSLRL